MNKNKKKGKAKKVAAKPVATPTPTSVVGPDGIERVPVRGQHGIEMVAIARHGASVMPGQAGRMDSVMAANATLIGRTPIEHLLYLMRDPEPKRSKTEEWDKWAALTMDAATRAAPYCHPKLSSVEHTGESKKLYEIKIAFERPGDHPRPAAMIIPDGETTPDPGPIEDS